jgi:hypothetical protein
MRGARGCEVALRRYRSAGPAASRSRRCGLSSRPPAARTPQAALADSYAPVAAGLVAIACAGAAFWPHGYGWRLPLALFVIPLLPVLGFTDFAYQNYSTVAHRYMYLALLGPAVAGAMAIDRLQAVKQGCTARRQSAARGGHPRRRLVSAAHLEAGWPVEGFPDSLHKLAQVGLREFRRPEQPRYRAHRAGRPDDALPLLLRAVERDPTDAGGWFNLGNAHAEGRPRDAAVCFEAAVTFKGYHRRPTKPLHSVRWARSPDRFFPAARYHSLSRLSSHASCGYHFHRRLW